MRTLACTLIGGGMMLVTAPTRAQTYDPSYPICLQTFGRAGSYIACGYTSMAQCQLSASGRAAQCIINPYFARAHTTPMDRLYQRHRRP
jgi:hypothetical protein